MDIKGFLNLLDCAYTLGIEDSHFGVRPKIPKKKIRSKNELFLSFWNFDFRVLLLVSKGGNFLNYL